MGKIIELTASDGFKLAAYRADPGVEPKGAIVIIQEIFGVNHHIRSVVDRYAANGYLALAPALFDRTQRGVELGYSEADMKRGFALRTALKDEGVLADSAAAVAELASSGLPVGIVGYCFGGLVAWLAAAHIDGITAAVGYYGGGIAKRLDDTPKVPTMLHFGARDTHIPASDVDSIRARHPAVTVHIYDADHGFNCDERGSYDPASAKIALDRTLAFFGEHLA